MAGENHMLGSLVRILRQQKGWTLRQMSDRVGIPLSTLAKVEADKLSLAYDKLQQFTSRVGLTMTEFLGLGGSADTEPASPVFTARRSLTTSGNSVRISICAVRYDDPESLRA
jgi:transcriptional regulator with XRE-family HTH domain